MKIFSRMLYIVLEQQWTSSTMAGDCQWSSRSRTILERIAAGSGPVIAGNALRTSTNKEVWIASILGKLGNWGGGGVEFSNSPYKRDRGVTQKWMSRNAELSAHAKTTKVEYRNLHAVPYRFALPTTTIQITSPFHHPVAVFVHSLSNNICHFQQQFSGFLPTVFVRAQLTSSPQQRAEPSSTQSHPTCSTLESRTFCSFCSFRYSR